MVARENMIWTNVVFIMFRRACFYPFYFLQHLQIMFACDATIVLINLHAATATPWVLISIILFFGSNNPKTIGHALLLFLYFCYIRSKKKSRTMFLHLELRTGWCILEMKNSHYQRSITRRYQRTQIFLFSYFNFYNQNI